MGELGDGRPRLLGFDGAGAGGDQHVHERVLARWAGAGRVGENLDPAVWLTPAAQRALGLFACQVGRVAEVDVGDRRARYDVVRYPRVQGGDRHDLDEV